MKSKASRYPGASADVDWSDGAYAYDVPRNTSTTSVRRLSALMSLSSVSRLFTCTTMVTLLVRRFLSRLTFTPMIGTPTLLTLVARSPIRETLS